MAEETTVEVEQTEEPQGEQKPEIDWKAEARKWENRAKKSEKAEQELQALKLSQMSEQEQATARAEKAEAELAEMKAEIERFEAAQAISERDGVPISLLQYCKDADAMDEFAREYKSTLAPVHAAASAKNARIISEAKPDNSQVFASFADQLFRR